MTDAFPSVSDAFAIGAEELKKGEVLFRQESSFVAGADTYDRLPPESAPEIAFAGRSNVGKSSLVNALTGTKGLARSSNTPGRTQQINFFALGHEALLVDLPGYGYASASRDKRDDWNQMVERYLENRGTLKTVCVLVDARRGLKDSDRGAMHVLEQAGVPFIVVLTKSDKIKPRELAAVTAATEQELESFSTACPKPCATSADTKKGIPELRAILALAI